MADRNRMARIQGRLLEWHEKHFEWLLDTLASPVAPFEWFKRLRAPGGPAGWAVGLAKWLVLIVWAVGFVWLWFLALWVLILWETFTPGPKRPAGAAPPHGSAG